MLFFLSILYQTFTSHIHLINKKFLDQQIRMISEGSCDTEDWSNDADKSAFPSQEYILKH